MSRLPGLFILLLMESQSNSVSQPWLSTHIIYKLQTLLMSCSHPPEILISLIWGMAWAHIGIFKSFTYDFNLWLKLGTIARRGIKSIIRFQGLSYEGGALELGIWNDHHGDELQIILERRFSPEFSFFNSPMSITGEPQWRSIKPMTLLTNYSIHM